MRFRYTFGDIIDYMRLCGWCRKKASMAKDPSMRKHVLFKKGEERLKGELDCITIMKTIKTLRLISKILLDSNQKKLLKF